MSTLEKKGNIFILTLTGDNDHRLNPTLTDSLRRNLDEIKTQSTDQSILITTSQGKFFSNGYHLNWAGSDESKLRLMDFKLRLLVSDIINLPMPTIAAVNGHASAGGFVLALSHDYIVMRKDRGFLYMSELDIGMTIPEWFVELIKGKSGDPKVWREVVLTAAKVTAERGVELGIVDMAVDGAEKTVEAAVGLGEALIGRKWKGHVYGDNRKVVFGSILRALDVWDEGSSITNDNKVISKL